LRLGFAALVAANLLIALQAVLRDWGYYETLLIYWLEAVVIGGYNVLRLFVVGLFGEQPFGAWISRWVGFSSWGSRLFYTVLGTGFFAFQFTGFALGVGLFVTTLPTWLARAGGAESSGHALEGLRAVGPGVAFGIGVLVLSHGFSFVRNFLLGREYVRRSVVGLIFWPYARMALVAFVLGLGLAAASLQPGLGSTTVFAVVMVLVKLAVDAMTHLWERRVFGRAATPAQQGET